MLATKKNEGYLSDLISERLFSVSRTAVYRWIDRYLDELIKQGIVSIERRGGKKYYYVNDLEGFYRFFEDRNVYLRNK